MNRLKELDVDIKRNLKKTSSETNVHIKSISTGFSQNIKQVDQGGIIELEYPAYDGVYEATPTTEEQVFATAEKSMLQDFTVHATPYSEVSNPQGGETVTIL